MERSGYLELDVGLELGVVVLVEVVHVEGVPLEVVVLHAVLGHVVVVLPLAVVHVPVADHVDHVDLLLDQLRLLAEDRLRLQLEEARQRQECVRPRLVLRPDPVHVQLVRQTVQPRVLQLRVVLDDVLQVVRLREVRLQQVHKLVDRVRHSRVVQHLHQVPHVVLPVEHDPLDLLIQNKS